MSPLRIRTAASTVFLLLVSSTSHAEPNRGSIAAYWKLPLHFETDQAISGAPASFSARSAGRRITVSSAGFVVEAGGGKGSSTLRARFAGGDTDARAEALDPLPGFSNYFLGSNAAQWRTRVPNYARIAIRSVYPGIDVVFYGHQGSLEFDFVLQPGADPRSIRMALDGGKVRLTKEGDVAIEAPFGEVRQRRPFVYQEQNGARRPVRGRYVRRADGDIGIVVADYNPRQPLIIDPVLQFSTYLGGAGSDEAAGVAVDGQGYVYVAGVSYSSAGFPQQQPLVSSPSQQTAFVTKFNPAGNTIVYSTYLGGPINASSGGNTVAGTYAYGIAADVSGNAYVTGYTHDVDFVTMNPLQRAAGLSDAFVAKIAPDGSQLVYSTYLGGAGEDQANGIAIDAAGNAYVAGTTSSSDFPLAAPLQSSSGGATCGFVTKINSGGSAKLFSTYLCGQLEARAIVVDAARNMYVAGRVRNSSFGVAPVQPVLGSPAGGWDGFLTRINADGASVQYSAFLSGSDDDVVRGVAVDAAGNAYVTGSTKSVDFPTVSPAQATFPAGAVETGFVAGVNAAGTALLYSTYLGGSGTTYGDGIAVDSAGNAVVAGETFAGSAAGFPIVDPIPSTFHQAADGFIARFDANGALKLATFLGGSKTDAAKAVALDGSGNIYVAGVTYSKDFPAVNAFQSASQSVSGGQAFVAKISLGAPAVRPVSVTPSSGSGASGRFTFLFSRDGGADGISSAQAWFTPAFSLTNFANSCKISYAPATNRLSLADNAGADGSAVLAGAAGTLANTQCVIDTSTALISKNGNDLALSLDITFLPGLAGAQQVWMTAADASTQSGWLQLGAWMVVLPPHTPYPISVSPSGGIGNPQNFTAIYTDSSGTAVLQHLYGWFTPSFNQTQSGGCMWDYDRSDQMNLALRLRNDAGTGWTTALPGVPAQNSACSINLVTMSNQNGVVTLTVGATFAGGFAGDKEIWLRATEAASDSGWIKKGTWQTNKPPSVITVSAAGYAAPAGYNGVIQVPISDSNGVSDLRTLYLWITPGFAAPAAGACRLKYDFLSGVVTLLDDAGVNYLSGNLGELRNHQCLVQSFVWSQPTAAFGVLLDPTFSGAKEVWADAIGALGDSGWKKLGAWTVPPPLQNVVRALNSGTGTDYQFQFEATDYYGDQDITQTAVAFTPSFAAGAANICRFYYDPASKLLNLLNDAGTGYVSGTLGTSGATVRNTQCTIFLDNAATLGGGSVGLNLRIQFSYSFAGAKELWQFTSGQTTDTGWQRTGTWVVPDPPTTPSAVSVTPATGSGGSRIFQFVFSDSVDAANLSQVTATFAPSSSTDRAHACAISYSTATGNVALLNDAGTANSYGKPGDLKPLWNSQCTVNLAQTSVSVSGRTLTFTVPVQFSSAFSGDKEVRLAAAAAGDLSTPAVLGHWTVPSSAVIFSASPSPATFGSAVTLTATLPADATGRVEFWDNGTPIGSAAVSGGSAVFRTAFLAGGLHALRATYNGNADYASSSAKTSLEVDATAAAPKDPVSYATGLHSCGVAVADFNGDGKADVAVTNGDLTRASSYVSVLLGNGDGTLGAPATMPAGLSPCPLVAADFNSDGKTDLAAGNDDGNVVVLLGNGDGTFQTGITIAVGRSVSALAVADVDGDAVPDLFVTTTLATDSTGAKHIFLLPGKGDGSFQAGAELSTAGASQVVTGDFDGDGAVDIAFFGASGGIVTELGDGKGGFQFGSNLTSSVNFASASLVSADFNGDGLSDLAAVDQSGRVIVRLRQAAGGFAPEAAYFSPGTNSALALASLSGAAVVDLIMADKAGNLVILPGKGDGKFGDAVAYPLPASATSLTAADFNGDGKTDIVLGIDGGAGIAVALGGPMPQLSVSATASGVFRQGETAYYTITVANGEAATARGVVKVTADVFTTLSGTGWTCGGNFCQTTTPLPAGGSYPAITAARFAAPSFVDHIVVTDEWFPPATLNFTAPVLPATIRINAGGASYNDSLGQIWAADSGYAQGFINSTSAAIAGTSDPALYRTERYSTGPTLAYQFSVPNGSYSVTLKFAELYYTSAGQRLFDIAINGATVSSGVDIFSRAGAANKALDLTFTVSVTGSQVSIVLTAVKGLAKINAIEIKAVAATPDFTIDADPTLAFLDPGATTPVAVTVAALNGFDSAVALDISGLPTGVTGTFSRTSISGGGAATLTLTAAASAPAAASTATIKGTSGAFVHSVSVPVVVNTTIANFQPIRVNAGGPGYTDSNGRQWSADTLSGGTSSTTAAITGTPDPALYKTDHYSASGPLTYTFSVPSGDFLVTLRFAETYYTASGRRVFAIRINGTVVAASVDVFAQAGAANKALDLTYPVTVGDGQVTISLEPIAGFPKVNALEIVPGTPPAADFSLTASPSATAVSGGSATYQVTTTATGGFSGVVTFSASGLPPGATAVFIPQTVTGGGSTTMTVMTGANTAAATSTITITASSGTLTHNTTASLTVAAAVAFSVIRVNAGGGAYTDSAGQVWSADTGYQQGAANSTTASIAGTADPQLYRTEHYSATGTLGYAFTVPNGNYSVKLGFAEIYYTEAGKRVFDVGINGSTAESHLDIFSAAGGANRALDRTYGCAVTNGQLTITLTGVTGFPKVNAIEISDANLTPASFSVSVGPPVATVIRGNSAMFTVTVTASAGFNGVVSLSGGTAPAGISISFNPPTVTGSGTSIMTLTTSSSTPLGSSSVPINAASGGVTHTSGATLDVLSDAQQTFSPIRVNAGGAAYLDSNGQTWSADTGFVQGTPNSTTAAISGTADPTLYRSEHYSATGQLTYQFTVPDGAYSVALHFAEIYYTSGGQRVFDIALNGSAVASGVDIYSLAGGANRALVLTYPVTVSAGQINITLSSVKGFPKINALAITTANPDFTLSASPQSRSITPGASTTYTLNTTASDGFTGAVSFAVSGLPTGATATFAPSTVSGSGSTVMTVTTTSASATPMANLQITASSGTISHTAAVSLIVATPPAFSPIRVNAGGAAYLDSNGQTWSADTGSVQGAANSTTAAISGTADPALYRSEHYSATGQLTYQFTVPNGAYSVALHFAEIYYTSGGQRVFDIALNGSAVATGVDIYSLAGGANRALALTYPVTVSAGQIDITLSSVKGFPKINALAITTANPDFTLLASPQSRSITPGASTTYTLTTAASGGFTGAVSFAVSGLPTGATATFAPSTVSGSGSTVMTVTTTSASATPMANLSITASSGTISHTAAVSLIVATPPAFSPIRVNAGGAAYLDSNGQTWSADTGFVQGAANSTTAAISGTADPTLYRSEHYNAGSQLTYQFTVPNGAYSVALHFAEIYYTSGGQRVFDIALNGSAVATGVDIYSLAGGANRALVLTYPVTVTGGQINITLSSVKGFPKINALQIVADNTTP